MLLNNIEDVTYGDLRRKTRYQILKDFHWNDLNVLQAFSFFSASSIPLHAAICSIAMYWDRWHWDNDFIAHFLVSVWPGRRKNGKLQELDNKNLPIWQFETVWLSSSYWETRLKDDYVIAATISPLVADLRRSWVGDQNRFKSAVLDKVHPPPSRHSPN